MHSFFNKFTITIIEFRKKGINSWKISRVKDELNTQIIEDAIRQVLSLN